VFLRKEEGEVLSTLSKETVPSGNPGQSRANFDKVRPSCTVSRETLLPDAEVAENNVENVFHIDPTGNTPQSPGRKTQFFRRDF